MCFFTPLAHFHFCLNLTRDTIDFMMMHPVLFRWVLDNDLWSLEKILIYRSIEYNTEPYLGIGGLLANHSKIVQKGPFSTEIFEFF